MEKEKITTDLRRCGYPNCAFQGKKKDKETKTLAWREQQGEQERSKMHVVLPYTQGMMERIQRVFRKHDIANHSIGGACLYVWMGGWVNGYMGSWVNMYTVM